MQIIMVFSYAHLARPLMRSAQRCEVMSGQARRDPPTPQCAALCEATAHSRSMPQTTDQVEPGYASLARAQETPRHRSGEPRRANRKTGPPRTPRITYNNN